MIRGERSVLGGGRGSRSGDLVGLSWASALSGWVWWIGWVAFVVLVSAPASADEAQRLVERGMQLDSGSGPVPSGAAEASRLFERACALGYAEGCVRLARQLDGRGVPRDGLRALELLVVACLGGHSQACAGLRVITEGEPSRRAGLSAELLRSAREASCLREGWSDCHALAEEFLSVDEPRAHALLWRACQRGGHDPACRRVVVVSTGEGRREPFDEELLAALRPGCEAGATSACQHVARWEAAPAAARACHSGQVDACEALIPMLRASPVPPSRGAWLEQGCRVGSGMACHEAGQSQHACRNLGYAPACEVLAQDARARHADAEQQEWLRAGCGAGDQAQCRARAQLDQRIRQAGQRIREVRASHRRGTVRAYVEEFAGHCCQEHVTQAKQRLEYLDRLEADWQGLRSRGRTHPQESAQALRNFLREHPHFESAAEVRAEIARLDAEVAAQERQRRERERQQAQQERERARAAQARERERASAAQRRERELRAGGAPEWLFHDGWVPVESVCRVLQGRATNCISAVRERGLLIYWAGEVTEVFWLAREEVFHRVRVRITWTSDESSYRCGQIYEFYQNQLTDFTHRSWAMRRC